MASKRKIELSYKGRLRFLPGDDHPLDVMLGEAKQLLEQIRGALEGVVGTLDEMNQAGDPLTTMLAEDQTLQQVIQRRYAEHKHRDHILATFMTFYRKRLLARLQAAQAALDLAKEFLSPDTTFLENVQQALATESPPDDPGQAQLVGEPLRVKGNLKSYEERLQTIRKAITAGNGWVETFFVTRTRLKPEFRELARRKQPFPGGEDPLETVTYGPYLKYRWREGQGPIYTISMGLIPNAGSGEGGVE